LPQGGGGQYQEYNPESPYYSGQITGGQDSTFTPGSGGIPLPGGTPPDIPGDQSAPNTPQYGATGNQPSDQSVIDKLGYDPGDPRSQLPTTGFGTGGPTQKAIGLIANFLGNAAIPGLGMLTGPAASKITQMIQNGASQEKVQQAIAQYQQGGGSPGGGNSGTGGFNFPQDLGGFGKRMGYFQPTGGWGQGDPGDYNPTGPMGGPGTSGIVDASSMAGGGSFFGGRMNPNMNLAGSWSNLGASGGSLAPGMANMYLHALPMQNWAQSQGFKNVGDWLRRTGFSLGGGGGGGAGLSGAGKPMTKAT
jgi:hypothetical protein